MIQNKISSDGSTVTSIALPVTILKAQAMKKEQDLFLHRIYPSFQTGKKFPNMIVACQNRDLNMYVFRTLETLLGYERSPHIPSSKEFVLHNVLVLPYLKRLGRWSDLGQIHTLTCKTST